MSFDEVKKRYEKQIEAKVPGKKYYRYTITTNKPGKTICIKERISYNEGLQEMWEAERKELERAEREYQAQEEERLERLWQRQFNRPARIYDPFREGLDIPDRYYEGLDIPL